MKISLQILTIIMFFGLNASAGAFPLVQFEHKSSLVVKVKMDKQCVAEVDRQLGCSFRLRKCLGQETGMPNNMSLKSIKKEIGANHYNELARRCKEQTDFERCWGIVERDCSS